MLNQQFKHSKVGNTLVAQPRSVLKLNEAWDPNLAIRQRMEPAFDFSEVVCIYRLTNVERRALKVEVDNPGVIAVVG